MSGLDILVNMKQWDPDLLVIIITGYASVESAVKALKLGAYDYIKKPFKADVIKLIVRLSLETQHLKKEVSTLKKQTEDLLGGQALVAESPVFLEMLQQVRSVAHHSDTTVLITGESGAGKDMIARTLGSGMRIFLRSQRHFWPSSTGNSQGTSRTSVWAQNNCF